MNRVFSSAAVLVFTVAASATTIRIDPPSSMGGTVDVNVQIADVQDLYAWQFDIAFDGAFVHAASVTEGDFLAGAGSTFFIPGSIDNAAGTITFTANTLLGPVAGVSGTGTLAAIRFAGVGLGTSPVTLSNVVLLDSASSDIGAAIQNGSIRVVDVEDVVVPEPGSTAMLLMAGAALAATRRLAKSRPGT